MLNLNCLEYTGVEISVQQVGKNSELMVRRVAGTIALDLFSLVIFRVMFLIVLYIKVHPHHFHILPMLQFYKSKQNKFYFHFT